MTFKTEQHSNWEEQQPSGLKLSSVERKFWTNKKSLRSYPGGSKVLKSWKIVFKHPLNSKKLHVYLRFFSRQTFRLTRKALKCRIYSFRSWKVYFRGVKNFSPFFVKLIPIGSNRSCAKECQEFEVACV